jgi:hypothetical protein
VNQAVTPPRSGLGRLRCRWEPVSSVAREIEGLTRRQQAEVGEDYEPYDPDWEVYFAHERSGSCAVWTARTFTGTLVGYIVWLTTRGLHCANTIFAEADLIYLAPEWRDGLTGYKFVKTGIAAVKKQGVDVVRIETNDLYEHGRMGVLLKRLGFRRIGSVWRS